MEIAVVGATGLVGTEILKVLAASPLAGHITRLIPVASARSVGGEVAFLGRQWPIISAQEAIAAGPEVAIFSAGGAISSELAPLFARAGTIVVDNSSAWRMDTAVPLIVPEVNGHALAGIHPGSGQGAIIANPNCSTIQMVVALQPLHAAFLLRRVVVSTYQSVTGSGQKGVAQLVAERAGQAGQARNYPHPIDLNLIPHIDSFLANGYTKEEMKMVHETRKIMGLPGLAITATAVRVPVMGGHSEAVNAEFERPLSVAEARRVLGAAPGVVLQDDPATALYPMPLLAAGQDPVFVGRLRMDEGQANTINMWIVADNLRKGAATNAVQIVEQLYQERL